MPGQSGRELKRGIGLPPREGVRMRPSCSPWATVSEASLSSDATCSSRGVTRRGVATVQPWQTSGVPHAEDKVALLACVGGSRGSRRARELAGVNVSAYLSCEADEPAKPVERNSWPTRTEVGTITSLTGQKVAEFLERHPRIFLHLVVAGEPGEDMPTSTIHDPGLGNQQSALFFELVRSEAERRQGLTNKVRLLAECVASRKEGERGECSRQLGCVPIVAGPTENSQCCREHPGWGNWVAETAWQAPTSRRGIVQQLKSPGGPGSTARWQRPGGKWPRSSGLDRFATLLRARPQKKKKPPLVVASDRDGVDETGLAPWARRLWRHSPHKFMPPNVVRDEHGPRTRAADKREVLPDVKRRHTMTGMPAGARKAAPQALELTRGGLLGDPRSRGVVAWRKQHLSHAEGQRDRARTVTERQQTSRGRSATRVPEQKLPLRFSRAHSSQADPHGSDERVDSGEVADPRS